MNDGSAESLSLAVSSNSQYRFTRVERKDVEQNGERRKKNGQGEWRKDKGGIRDVE
jgi:hypothetical protein